MIVEPVAANMGLVPPAPGFLEGLRAACDRVGALLIFDEVITGFRIAYGGAAGVLRRAARPLVLRQGDRRWAARSAAFGGRRDVMEQLAPVGPVYQAGTLSGNPLATAAGLAVARRARRRRPTRSWPPGCGRLRPPGWRRRLGPDVQVPVAGPLVGRVLRVRAGHRLRRGRRRRRPPDATRPDARPARARRGDRARRLRGPVPQPGPQRRRHRPDGRGVRWQRRGRPGRRPAG